MAIIYLFLFFLTGPECNKAHFSATHPYYISVTEIEYNAMAGQVGVACKIFTDDFEEALKEETRLSVDITNTRDTVLLKKQMANYLKQHLRFKADGHLLNTVFIGFEIEGEATWCYIQADEVPPYKTLGVFNDLLYQYKREQVNFMHYKNGRNKQTVRLTQPETMSIFH